MLYYRRSRFLRRVILPITLLSFLSACHKWVELKPPYEQAFAEEQPEKVRLTVVGNSRLVLEEPRVQGDTLFGLSRRTGVPLDQIQRAEVRQDDMVANVFLITGIAVTVGLLVYGAIEGRRVMAEGLGAWLGELAED
jgi:hypothetical protein